MYSLFFRIHGSQLSLSSFFLEDTRCADADHTVVVGIAAVNTLCLMQLTVRYIEKDAENQFRGVRAQQMSESLV